MSGVCVCGCKGSGHDLSTARGTLNAAGGQGVRSTWQLNTYSCSQLLQTCCVICNCCKVKNHILNRNGAQWHYNTLRL